MSLPEYFVVLERKQDSSYPSELPFHPSESYPEYPFGQLLASAPNPVYEMVRQALLGLELDLPNMGTAAWNPIGELVKPGATVLIKPNMVLDRHPHGGDLFCLITHGSVVRAILDYVFVALKGKGRVVIGDAPIQSTDFQQAAQQTGLQAVIEFYRKQTRMDVQLVDFRSVIGRREPDGHIKEWVAAPGDPAGCVEFDLREVSMLNVIAHEFERFRVSNYPPAETRKYHTLHSHRYVMAKTLLDADLVISVPKMKTHCKVGVTLGLKNFVGTVARKQCLAHHRKGGSLEGGDEYPGKSALKDFSETLERTIDGNIHPRLRKALKLLYRVNERLIKKLKIDPIRDGGWYGNDTAWRMTLDLVRIARYGTADGQLDSKPKRELLTIIDGVVAGENNGPLEATARKAGVILAGLNPVATDIAGATLMGFDYEKIPLIRGALNPSDRPLAGFPPRRVRILASEGELTLDGLARSKRQRGFVPPPGWSGHIQFDSTA